MHKLFLAIILAIGSISVSCAQDNRFEYKDSSLLNDSGKDTETVTTTEERDILSDTSVIISSISLHADTVAGWKSDKRFAYAKNLDTLLKIKQQEDLDEYNKRLKEKPNNFIAALFASGLPQILFWTIAIGFVVFILYKLFLSNGVFKRSPKAAVTKNTEVQPDELIATVADYDKLVHQSVKLGDYRMAVRYQFLKTLAQLSDKEYIYRSVDKTNYEYVREIRADKKNEFAALVLNYEYIWYGNFPVNSDTYTGIEKKFSTFYKKI